MSRLVDKIDLEIERRSLLKHPFYVSWSKGDLTVDQLAGYSKEYFQLVRKVPRLVENVGSKAVDSSIRAPVLQNLKEETEHIEPWVRFAGALGVSEDELVSYQGTSSTRKAILALERLSESSFEESVAAMYAYEKELPKISRTKIDGLAKFYGLGEGDATRYFEIHETADVRHAQLWRDILMKVPDDKAQASLKSAIQSLAAQNRLLDSVMERYC